MKQLLTVFFVFSLACGSPLFAEEPDLAAQAPPPPAAQAESAPKIRRQQRQIPESGSLGQRRGAGRAKQKQKKPPLAAPAKGRPFPPAVEALKDSLVLIAVKNKNGEVIAAATGFLVKGGLVAGAFSKINFAFFEGSPNAVFAYSYKNISNFLRRQKLSARRQAANSSAPSSSPGQGSASKEHEDGRLPPAEGSHKAALWHPLQLAGRSAKPAALKRTAAFMPAENLILLEFNWGAAGPPGRPVPIRILPRDPSPSTERFYIMGISSAGSLRKAEARGISWLPDKERMDFAADSVRLQGLNGSPVVDREGRAVMALAHSSFNYGYGSEGRFINAMLERPPLDCPSLKDCVLEARKELLRESKAGNIKARHELYLQGGYFYDFMASISAGREMSGPVLHKMAGLYAEARLLFFLLHNTRWSILEAQPKEWLEWAERMGDPMTQHSTGLLYKGKDRPAAALGWFSKAAQRDFAPAEFESGLIYKNVFKNYSLAMNQLLKAARKGHKDAQIEAGLIWLQADRQARGLQPLESGVSRPPPFSWSALRSPPGQGQLQAWSQKQIQAGRNPRKHAYKWLLSAANQGCPLAMWHIANMYKEDGKTGLALQALRRAEERYREKAARREGLGFSKRERLREELKESGLKASIRQAIETWEKEPAPAAGSPCRNSFFPA